MTIVTEIPKANDGSLYVMTFGHVFSMHLKSIHRRYLSLGLQTPLPPVLSHPPLTLPCTDLPIYNPLEPNLPLFNIVETYSTESGLVYWESMCLIILTLREESHLWRHRNQRTPIALVSRYHKRQSKVRHTIIIKYRYKFYTCCAVISLSMCIKNKSKINKCWNIFQNVYYCSYTLTSFVRLLIAK